jgi:hypothetical protein
MFEAKNNSIQGNIINDTENDNLHILMKQYLNQKIPSQPNIECLEHIYELMDASVDQAPEYGHTMVIKYIFSFTNESGTYIYLLIKNSWGLKWANGGYIIIPIEGIPHVEMHSFILKRKDEEIREENKHNHMIKHREPMNKTIFEGMNIDIPTEREEENIRKQRILLKQIRQRNKALWEHRRLQLRIGGNQYNKTRRRKTKRRKTKRRNKTKRRKNKRHRKTTKRRRIKSTA